MNAPKTESRHLLAHSPKVWDALIALTLCIGIGMTWFGITYGGLWLILGILGVIGTVLTLYGSFVEPKRIKVNTKIVRKENFPPIRIAVMADMHVGPYKGSRYMKRVVDRLMHEKPDLILLPGDFLFGHESNVQDLEPFKKLRAPAGVFAVVGNHDSGQHHYTTVLGNNLKLSYPDRTDNLDTFFKGIGITLLRNKSTIIEHSGKKICIGGVDDMWMPTHNIPSTIDSMDTSLPSIFLCHNPDGAMDMRTREVDLIVSGHTHGGQIRLPFIGPLRSIPNKMGRKFDEGLFELSNKTTLLITHGIGEMLARARLFCTPEIVMLDINN